MESGNEDRRSFGWIDRAGLGRSVLRPYNCTHVSSVEWAAAEILRFAQEQVSGWQDSGSLSLDGNGRGEEARSDGLRFKVSA